MVEVKNELRKFSDEDIFLEASQRLRSRFRTIMGIDFHYGCFEFIFHDGRFKGIGVKHKWKFFINPTSLTGVKPQLH
ncbi:hypothetical protein WDW86_05005 [Bdellovibrionota bacterium FG-2]